MSDERATDAMGDTQFEATVLALNIAAAGFKSVVIPKNLPLIIAEARRARAAEAALAMSLQGRDKAIELLYKGMESQAGNYSRMKQEARRAVEAEAALAARLAKLQAAAAPLVEYVEKLDAAARNAGQPPKDDGETIGFRWVGGLEEGRWAPTLGDLRRLKGACDAG